MTHPMSSSLADLLSTAREFVDREVIPLEPLFLTGSHEELEPRVAKVRALAKTMGMWAPALPKEVGGAGMSLVEFAHLSEQLGRTPLGHFVCNAQAPDVGNMELLLQFGSEGQKERWLKPLVAGDIRSSFSMTEPGHAGSNPTWMSTTAIRDGDEDVINGDKWFTSAADGAAFTIVMAVTNPEADRYRRASQIIVPMGTPGVTRVRNTPGMGDTGSGWGSHSGGPVNQCR